MGKRDGRGGDDLVDRAVIACPKPTVVLAQAAWTAELGWLPRVAAFSGIEHG